MIHDFAVPIVGIVGHDGIAPRPNEEFFSTLSFFLNKHETHYRNLSTMSLSKKYVSEIILSGASRLDDESFMFSKFIPRKSLNVRDEIKHINSSILDFFLERYFQYSEKDVSSMIEQRRDFDGVLIFMDVYRDKEVDVIREYGGIICHVNGLPRKKDNKIRIPIDVFRRPDDPVFEYDKKYMRTFFKKNISPYVADAVQSIYFTKNLNDGDRLSSEADEYLKSYHF